MSRKVNFKSPPVVEVVCGVLFAPLADFKVPHFGRYWERIRDNFSRVDERSPIIRHPAGTILQDEVFLPQRVWYFTEDDHRLIQLQRDRFNFNWKRATSDEIEYYRFANIFPEFLKQFQGFENFIREADLGKIEVQMFELTYVNHIEKESAEAVGLDLADVLVDHVRDRDRKRFLPEPRDFNWTTRYAFPDSAGHLNVTAGTAQRPSDRATVLRLDLAAVGALDDKSHDGMQRWFDLAHDWIVNGFVDITSPKMQDEIWQRES
jgi:uncharacterized protein (TIGR04255 family)